MARKRSPETFEKRKRAFEKQRKRADKLAERIARNAAKKEGEGAEGDDIVELDEDGNPIIRESEDGLRGPDDLDSEGVHR